VKRVILVYGICGGLLVAALQIVRYQFLIVEHSREIYGGVIAIVFAAVGIRLGLTLTRTKEVIVVREVAAPVEPFVANGVKLAELGITPRELEILQQIATGKSTREIAQTLFVSENTVKTHASRLFDKLGVGRRTQAVHIGKRFGLIP
jgi:NarL family two-component system response regulator LiaR